MRSFVRFCASILLSSLSVAVLPSSASFPATASGGGVSKADKLCMPELKSAFQYYWGRDGIKKDRAVARQMLEPLAQRGCPSAQSALGTMYGFGQGGVQDLSLAIYWTQRAADQDNPSALINLGRLYLNGKGVKKDSAKAYSLLERAALQGDSEAQCLAGMLKYKEKDKSKGLYWLRAAAAQGHSIAKSVLESKETLESIKKKGLPPPTKSPPSLPCQENPVWKEKVSVAFEFITGMSATEGRIERDLAKGRDLLEEVAQEGCPDAQFLLGCIYLGYSNFDKKHQVKVEKDKGFFWIKKAAEQGHKDALITLDELEDR